MKPYLFLAIFFFIITSTISGQSTERFIRILGNAQKDFLANGAVANIVISEQQPNEYKQVKYRPFEMVYAEYIAELNKLGIQENQLIRNQKNITKFTQTTTKDYSLRLADLKTFEAVAAIPVLGASVTDLKYSFTNIPADTEQLLALEAIEDARRKAKSLCAELGMKLGKILNIEDTSSGCCSTIDDNQNSKVKKDYKVNVTFELLDK